MWTPPINESAELTQGALWLILYSEGRTPSICTLWVPIHLSFNNQQGPFPLLSLWTEPQFSSVWLCLCFSWCKLGEGVSWGRSIAVCAAVVQVYSVYTSVLYLMKMSTAKMACPTPYMYLILFVTHIYSVTLKQLRYTLFTCLRTVQHIYRHHSIKCTYRTKE